MNPFGYNSIQLQEKANDIRQDIVTSLLAAGSGHSAGPLGMADIFTALYFNVANVDGKNIDDANRDRIVLSSGHICPVLYVTMAHAGYFPRKELQTLRKFGSRLQGHPHRESLPGLETTSGPLGSGLSQGVGMAYALRMNRSRARVWVVGSDGEHDEGNTWEAVMFAGKHRLHNITYIIDRNNIQIDGFTEDIMPLEPLRDKYEAFNWHVEDINGHNMDAIVNALEEARAIQEKPTCCAHCVGKFHTAKRVKRIKHVSFPRVTTALIRSQENRTRAHTRWVWTWLS
ncbi:MAG: Transketolase domain protein [Parcubacteria group bacterium GW2011_GWA2_47_8]|nr:MAG: Transketolase domain protein [Parcubacteria group bacterium GW2011_GWA2_47_8]